MKIRTVPFSPLSLASDCSAPFTSTKVKSVTVEPMLRVVADGPTPAPLGPGACAEAVTASKRVDRAKASANIRCFLITSFDTPFQKLSWKNSSDRARDTSDEMRRRGDMVTRGHGEKKAALILLLFSPRHRVFRPALFKVNRQSIRFSCSLKTCRPSTTRQKPMCCQRPTESLLKSGTACPLSIAASRARLPGFKY